MRRKSIDHLGLNDGRVHIKHKQLWRMLKHLDGANEHVRSALLNNVVQLSPFIVREFAVATRHK